MALKNEKKENKEYSDFENKNEYSTAETAQLLGVSQITIRVWIYNNFLKANKDGRYWKISRVDIDKIKAKLYNTVENYALRTGRHAEGVRESLRRGTLKGHKEAGMWYIDQK